MISLVWAQPFGRISDADGVPHEFRFFVRLHGDGIALAAHEIKDGDRKATNSM
jgi:hypothetical protein